MHPAAMLRERLYAASRLARLPLPEPNRPSEVATGEQVPIGGESQTGDPLRLPTRPEQGPTGHVPQLDAAIRAPARERAFVRAEGEAPDTVRVGPPAQVQGLAGLMPYAHFSPLVSCSSVLPATADGDRCDDIKGLAKDALPHERSGQIGLLHLDALQIRAAQGQMRQVQPTQIPAQQPQ